MIIDGQSDVRLSFFFKERNTRFSKRKNNTPLLCNACSNTPKKEKYLLFWGLCEGGRIVMRPAAESVFKKGTKTETGSRGCKSLPSLKPFVKKKEVLTTEI